MKNSNQVLTVDFSRNLLLLATFRAESGVGLVGSGDGGPFGAMGFAGRGRTEADRAFFSLSTLPLAFFADLWPFRVFHRRPLVQGGSARGGEASAPLALSNRRRNLAKSGHLRSGFLKTHVGRRRFGPFPAKRWRQWRRGGAVRPRWARRPANQLRQWPKMARPVAVVNRVI